MDARALEVAKNAQKNKEPLKKRWIADNLK